MVKTLVNALAAIFLFASVRADEPVKVTKTGVLSNLVLNVIVPAYETFAKNSTSLRESVTNLIASPNAEKLQVAQEKWKTTIISWKFAQSFRFGPTVDSDLTFRIYYWPPRRASIESVLKDKKAIDQEYIAGLGVTATGLGALECLLFDQKKGDASIVDTLSGGNFMRRREYLAGLASDLQAKSADLVQAWKNESASKGIIAGGQDTLSLAVNALAAALESGAVTKFAQTIASPPARLVLPELFDGGNSGTSQELVLAILRGAHALFTGVDGAGMDDWLTLVGSPLGQSLNEQFGKTIAAVEAIKGPLELGFRNNSALVQAASDKCKKLELMVKVDLTSALGVTLTFSSVDGD